jgi:geranylgeranyl diphosphate synthase, type II
MHLGGKRLRPLLTLLSYTLFKQNIKNVIPYTVAIEAFHNFTLMHDDIMDKAPVRRGKPTVHKKWNMSTAILSGDVMLVKVYEMFSALEPEKFKDVVKAFNKCASQVCEGQQWDMEFEKIETVSEAQYINMIKLKTAVLLKKVKRPYVNSESILELLFSFVMTCWTRTLIPGNLANK